MQNVSFGREVASIALKVFAVVTTFILIIAVTNFWYYETPISDGTCNIAVLPIEGTILPFAAYDQFELVTTPGMVRDFVELAQDDPFIDGVLFEINSPGGTPVASEQISDIITGLSLPNISLVGDMAASGGYLIAASADAVIASPMSDVGSIGVTMSYLENSKQNEEEGLTFVELASGKFKDSGNPNKAITEEERALFEKDLAVVHDLFIKKVAEVRNVPETTIAALADGSSMPGVRALEAGLVDSLGGRAAVKNLFAEKLGLNQSDVTFCEYTPSLLPF